jgi:hypothetical protein
MDAKRPLRVTLTGEVSGDYIVLEKRSDGSLVVAPDTLDRSAGAARRPASHGGTLLSGLLAPPNKAPMSDVEVLEGWGVELGEDERISEFFVADVDGRMGFLAITSQRFIFVADSGKRERVVREHMLSAARNVDLVRRGLRHKLRVTWHGVDSLIETADRKALSRLRHYLEG